jgi:predicted nucleotidyltransferase
MNPRHLNIPQEQVAAFCRRWHIVELGLFGSVLREDFRPESDIDVLVTFQADCRWSLLDLITMQEELKEILGRDIDLVEKKVVERSENYIRRRHILRSIEPLYVAG